VRDRKWSRAGSQTGQPPPRMNPGVRHAEGPTQTAVAWIRSCLMRCSARPAGGGGRGGRASARSCSMPMRGHATRAWGPAFTCQHTPPPPQDEMARTQKNKATSGHLGSLKVRTARHARSCRMRHQRHTRHSAMCLLSPATHAQTHSHAHILPACLPVHPQAKLAKLRREILEPKGGGGGGAGDGACFTAQHPLRLQFRRRGGKL
jgi:hypothetical protein